ncbi:hypothetical protein [Spirillospora sp. NPDC047279]|uniref:hypothetical protein n=1 Tax=Spirillospora sp. NPDC047279 TaxID=3155478 RepID=UPI0033F89538
MAGRHRKPRRVDLSDEAGWFRDEVVPDLAEDGKLSKANADRLKRVVLALVEGAVLAALITAGPAVWSEIQSGNHNLPSLLNTGGTVAVAAVFAFLRASK